MEAINCNHEIKPGYRFCPLCGISIDNIKVNIESGYVEDVGDYIDGFDPKLFDM